MLCRPSLSNTVFCHSLLYCHIFEGKDPYMQKKKGKILTWLTFLRFRENGLFFFSQHSSNFLPSVHQWETCACTTKILKGSFCRFLPEVLTHLQHGFFTALKFILSSFIIQHPNGDHAYFVPKKNQYVQTLKSGFRQLNTEHVWILML